MAFLIPSYIQKRLLRYALSQFPVVDTDTLDLEQLDIAWGKRSSVELRDVGLHVKKLAHMLHLPDEVQIIKSRVLSLRITVPADIYSSGIEVDVQGIDVHVQLDRRKDVATPRTPKAGKRARVQEPAAEDEDDHIPTAEELAESFLNDEPAVERKELEEAIQNAGLLPSDDSDAASEASDEETGQGVGLAVPAFLANFLKGVIDRIQMSIKNVKFILDSELPPDSDLPTENPAVSLHFVVSSVQIDGFTHDANSEENESADPERRKVKLLNIYGDLVTENALFTSLERVSTAASSRRAPSSAPSSPNPQEHSGQFSAPRFSPAASQSSRRPPSSLSEASHMTGSRIHESLSRSRISAKSESRLQSSLYSQDRFEDASDDGHSVMSDSMHQSTHEPMQESRFYPPSSISGSQIAPSEFDNDPEDGLPFMMEDTRSAYGYDSQELDPFAAMQTSYNQQRTLSGHGSLSGHGRRRQPYASATAPMTPLRSTHSPELDRRRPVYSSQPAPRRKLDMLASASTTRDESPPALPSPPKSDSSDSPSEGAEASLAQSMLYSHEEAQSMYMSALGDPQSEHYDMPGGWGGSVSSDGSNKAQAAQKAAQETAEALSREIEGSGVETPRPRSPSNTSSSSPESRFRRAVASDDGSPHSSSSPRTTTVSKRLFSIDEIVLGLPWAKASDGPEAVAAGDAPIARSPPQSKAGRPMPGAFSQYQSVFSERFQDKQKSSVHARFGEPTVADSVASLGAESVILLPPADPDVTVDVGKSECFLDTASTRLLYRLAQQVADVWAAQPPAPETKKPAPASQVQEPLPTVLLKLQQFTFGFMENLPTLATSTQIGISRSTSSPVDPLFVVDAQGMTLSNASAGSTLHVRLEVQTFKTGYPDDPILSFDRSLKRQSLARSKILSKEPDVKIDFEISPERGPELTVKTVPIMLTLNLQELDDRLLMFGGVSGILDLSSSVASNSTILGPSPAKARPSNVRFGDAAPPETPTLSPVKVNARFYGATVLLEGKSCAVSIDASTIGVIVRNDKARVQIEEIQLKAPYNPQDPTSTAFKVDLIRSRVLFLVSGLEEDFESLVALIEPSRDRYENDDDVLLDMLRRQRKNGSVLRFDVDDIKATVENLEHLEPLQQLTDELGRLSSGVTKYLPEDDRPGILILPKIKHFHVQADVMEKLGLIDVSCSEVDVAYVGTPLLLGFKLAAVQASRNEDVIVDGLLDLNGSKNITPAIMGRFIGNVPESRMKLKFFNLLLEYKIPMILAILGVSEVETVEDLAMNLASSVATLKIDESPPASDIASPARPPGSKKPSEPLRLDIFVRDCAIGLNPAKSDAKALALMSQAQISIDDAGKNGLQIVPDLKRASLLLIDDLETLDTSIKPAPRPYDSDNLSPAIDDLTRSGFVPVASIWSAQTSVIITQDDEGETMIDVQPNIKLVTLETCADSQQTLGAVMGGLAPPLPKKKEQMYRTHVVPIENMMASFTGEAFIQSESGAGDGPDDEGLNMEDADQILEDIPSNMDFVGSFYDPDEETSQYNPSVLGSVNRLSSRLLAPSKNDKVSFADSLDENFEHGADNVLIDPSENYLEVFKFKAPARRWNKKKARLEPIYATDTKKFPAKVTANVEQITWNMYDGYDWAATRDKIAQAVEKVEAKIEERRRARRTSTRDDDDAESEIEDMLFQSIWIAVPANADERDLRRGINKQIADEYTETGSTRTESVDTRTTGGRPIHKRRKSKALHLERSRKKISFDLRNTVADFFMLPPGSEETQNSLALRVGDFEIFDHVPSSTWKKFLTYLHDAGERQMGKPMIRLDAVTVKQVADLAATELVLKVNLLPIRLHVDQDALDFMTRFFEFKDDRAQPSSGEPAGPYIARLEVNTIPVALDYKPKKVDYAGLRSGSTSEFANFIILDRAEFQLKRLILYGIQSPDVLQPKLKAIWTADVINNQLPTVLSGLSGVRPLVDVGSGIRNLVVVPMREYQKDGRIVRSIQKGALAFAKNTTSELARLGAKVAIGTQTALEGAEGLLSPTSERRNRRRTDDEWDVDDFSTSPAREEPRAVSNYADQPLNIVTGVRDAWQGLERDLLTAKDAIIAIGGDVRESGSAIGAVGAVARLAPTVILRPAIGATRGIGMALLGAGNMLDKDARRKVEDKYKRY